MMKSKITKLINNRYIVFAALVLAWFMPIQSQAESESFHKLAAEWWQWVSSFPNEEDPIEDLNGDRCMVGQKGKEWFLVGSYGQTVVRNCAIPEGTNLFFPVINNFTLDVPGACGQPIDELTPVAEMRSLLAPFINGATHLKATLDGKPLPMRRAKSEVFYVVFPINGRFADACADEAGGLPATIYSPSVADGIWSQVKAIKDNDGDDNNPGTFETDHVLHIHAESTVNPSFILDVTYNLDVVPLRTK
jgi:hypothetical protein